MNQLQIVKTADGSNTIFNPQVGENYHSTHGALQESEHVFLNAGLRYFLETHALYPTAATDSSSFNGVQPEVSPIIKDSENHLARALPDAISVLEVGFGTGLNFLLSAYFCTEKNIALNYTGIEAYPLSAAMISETGYEQYVSSPVWEKFIDIYNDSLLTSKDLNNFCRLRIVEELLLSFRSGKQFDIIYFDAFAAAYQPEMWNEAAINHTVQFLKPGGVFVTYAITGNLKRTLKALGCKIEKVKGAAGKREMLRAVKLFV